MQKIGASILVNQICNNNCKYCYQTKNDEKFMNLEMFKNIINFLYQINSWDKTIEFFGGEPMLNENLIKTIVKTFPDLTFSMITNGFFILEDDYYKYFNGLEKIHITVSIESNVYSHSYYRNPQNSYEKLLSRILKLSEDYNLSLNISINDFMFIYLDETIANLKKIIDKNIEVHFYMLKAEDGINSIEQLKTYLNQLRSKDLEIYNYILRNLIKDICSDFEYLCSFDSKLTILPNGDIVSCSWDNTLFGNVLKDEPGMIIKHWVERTSLNHKDLWAGCAKCEVPVGVCNLSCPPFIIGLLETDNIDKLNLYCEKQKVLYRERRKG